MPVHHRTTMLAAGLGSAALTAAQAQDSATGAAELGTLVLTASGYEQQLADAPATITVIGDDELEGQSYETVADVLDTVPGIALETGGKLNAPSISIRGLSEDYVLFLVDGRPIGSTSEAFYNGYGQGQKAGYLPPPSAIERIEVIRGPMSSLYGTDAAGGVINVITKSVPEEWGGELTFGTTLQENDEAGDSTEGRFYISGPVVEDTLGLTLYGQSFDRDGDTFVPGKAEGSRRTLGGRLTWAIDPNNELEFDVSRTEQDFENVLLRRGELSTGEVKNTYTNYGLTHTARWGEMNDTTTFVIDEDVDITNGDYGSSYGKTQINSKTTLFLDRQTLTLGADYSEETTSHDAERFSPSVATNLDRWHYAFFAEDEIDITSDFALTLGLRFDDNENYGSNITPRVYGVYDVTHSVTIKGGVSGGYKVPELKQADSAIAEPSGGPSNNALDIGNTDLQPEESTNYEIGVVWTGPGGLQMGATAYHTTFENKIDRDTICNTPDADIFDLGGQAAGTCSYGELENYVFISEYVNRDEAELSGVELTLDVPVGDFDISANYTYSDAEITSGENAGQPFNNLPRHGANLGLDWEPQGRRYGAWGDAKFRGETIGLADDRIPSYVIVDVGLDYDFTDSVRGSFAVQNLFDKQIDSLSYDRVLDGRRFYAALTSRF